MAEQVRVRFAPSPTGYLHVGGARTALFNWLLARHTGGVFVLRIEDTDTGREKENAVQAIFDGLKWLGLTWDEGPGAAEPHGPYFQTQRLDIYNRYVQQLLESGRAYKCWMTPEQLEAKRNEATAAGAQYRYQRAWAAQHEAPGQPFVVRFQAPTEGAIVVDDLVHGTVTFDAKEMVDDFVIVKKDGIPTYNFAVVIDDATMAITHVIRGDDHLSNTPKQVALYQALGIVPPRFGHIPMILGPDKVKLSKRHGAVAVTQYEDEGFLPHALVNYLVRLGWSHGDQEIFSLEEMVAAFSTDALNKTAAVFDVQKLSWLNAHYIKTSSPAELVPLLRRHWDTLGLDHASRPQAWLEYAVRTLQERATNLVELAKGSRVYFDVALTYDPAAVAKQLGPDNREMLGALRGRLEALPAWTAAVLEPVFKGFAEERGLKLGGVIQPVRVAVTGSTASAGMYDVLELVGRDASLRRMAEAMALPAAQA
ncbi:MAG: glutamyl-tRNA synthetase [Cyanobacteria bacterium RYN_339]|nr:glutamyl-tRNA synthetase [Cyanobacteria bacterium RYN_339]